MHETQISSTRIYHGISRRPLGNSGFTATQARSWEETYGTISRTEFQRNKSNYNLRIPCCQIVKCVSSLSRLILADQSSGTTVKSKTETNPLNPRHRATSVVQEQYPSIYHSLMMSTRRCVDGMKECRGRKSQIMIMKCLLFQGYLLSLNSDGFPTQGSPLELWLQ